VILYIIMSGMTQTTPKQTELQKSKIFMDALNELMGIVDDISQEMTNEQYLNASNAMKRLYDNKVTIVNNIMQTPVVREHERRVRRNLAPRVFMTDEQRVALGKAYRCVKCDRCISASDQDDPNMRLHKEREICNNIYASKRLALKVGSTNIQKYLPIINAIRRWSMKSGREYHL
jgi:ribosomal protein S13